MASGKIANLSVGVSLDKSEFSAGLNKAEAEAQAFQQHMQTRAVAIGTAMGGFIKEGIESAVKAFPQLFNAAVDAMDAFNDLSDATGSSVENISALDSVARRTGASFEAVETSLIKFNKVLKDAGTDSSASEVIKAIGLNAEELKRIDPAEALRLTAVALSKFADDGNKARIIQELFGKSLKEVAPFLKDLSEQSSLAAATTTEAAQAAETYNKQIFQLRAEVEDLTRSLVSGLLPSLIETGKQIRELFGGAKAPSTLKTEISNLQTNLDKLKGMEGKGYTIAGFFGSEGDRAAEIKKIEKQLLDANALFEKAVPAPDTSVKPSAPDTSKIEEGRKARLKGEKDAEAAAKRSAAAAASEAKRANEQAESYIDSLNKQIEKTQELSAVQQVAADVAAKRVKFSGGQRGEADAAATRIDAHKEEMRILDELSAAQEEVIADRQRAGAAAAAEADSQVKSNEALRAEIESIGLNRQGLLALEQARIANTIATKQSSLAELEAGGVTTAASAAIRDEIVALQERAGLLVKREAADAAAANLQRIADKAREVEQSIEQTLGSQLSDALGGNFDDIGKRWVSLLQRMVADALAADLMAKLTGKEGGNSAALYKGIAGLAGSYFGGGGFTGAPGQSSVDYGLAAGTNYVPRDMMTKVHQGEAVVPAAYNPAIGGGAVAVKLENNGPPLRAEAKSERQPDGTQLVKIMLSAVAADIKQGGKVGGAMSDQFGLKRNLPRRA